jgi:hypothetical protein
MIDEYKNGIDRVINGTADDVDRCLFGTITSLFDDVDLAVNNNYNIFTL